MKTITVAMWDPGFSLQDLSLEEKINCIEKKFKEAYELAMTSEPFDEDETFVFMCPEFTLLDMNNYEKSFSFPKKDFLEAEKRLLKLASDYPRAIIIPGTAYVEKKLDLGDQVKEKKYAETIKQWQLKNLKRLQDFKKEIKDKTLVKNIASIFFHSSEDKPKRYAKRVEAGEYIDAWSGIFYSGHSSAVFSQNGVRFGIEICADHKDGILRLEQKRTGQQVDVHLIVANVMHTIPSKVAESEESTIVINCAGNFTYNPIAAKSTGVWVTNGQGDLEPVEKAEASTKDLQIYLKIPVLNQKNTPSSSIQ